jgi:chemotaxis signal transduction protein
VDATLQAFATGSELQGLECEIGRFRVVVPTPFVGAVVEMDLSAPPPLASKWIGGLGYYEGKAVVCLTLARASRYPARRLSKGILLSLTQALSVVLEVDAVRSFRLVKVLPRKQVTQAQPSTPDWVTPATESAGQTVALIDVPRMVRDLVGT